MLLEGSKPSFLAYYLQEIFMSKYSQEHLSAMAKSALWHKAHSPVAYTHFIHILSLATRTSLPEVELKILQLSCLNTEQQSTN